MNGSTYNVDFDSGIKGVTDLTTSQVRIESNEYLYLCKLKKTIQLCIFKEEELLYNVAHERSGELQLLQKFMMESARAASMMQMTEVSGVFKQLSMDKIMYSRKSLMFSKMQWKLKNWICWQPNWTDRQKLNRI